MITQLQATLDNIAFTEGSKRYFKQLETSSKREVPLDRTDLRKLLRSALPLVSSQLRVKLEADLKGRHPKAFQVLQHLDPDLIALVGLSGCFKIISESKPLVSVCNNIGFNIDAELWAAKLHKDDAKLAQRLTERALRKHGNIRYRRKAVKAVAKKEGHDTSILTSEEKVLVGGFVLDAVLKAVPEVFQVYMVTRNKIRTNYLGLTPEAGEEIARTQEVQAWMRPMYLPMVIPPKPWTTFDFGAYHNEKLARSVSLVRTFDKRHIAIVKKAIADGTMRPVLDAVNTIQSTRWAINKPILDLVEWAYEANKHLPSFPPRHHLPAPVRPADFDSLAADQKKGWRISAAQVNQRNRGIDGERITIMYDLYTARLLQDAPEFYIPHNMDFRGRVYSVPHFNQQRSDYVKAMLQFAEGHVLTSSGAYWLAVHLANVGDFDKVSKAPFDQRAEWVSTNEEMIFKVAQDPKGTFDIWSQADKPFSFVAACMEWYGYRCNPESFMSHIAVAMDGSNSGLQHYSCMMRSEREGALVNLVPSERPADLYQTVANRVLEMAKEDAEKDLEVAKVCLEAGITRKLCKRATMTFAYSSEEYGFKQQLMSDFMDPAAVDVLTGRLPRHPWAIMKTDKEGVTKLDDGFTAAGYLARLIWKAVNEIVTDACTGMAFFRRCAQVLAHEGKGVLWHTPVGLPVLHLYSEMKSKKLKMFLHDREVRVITQTDPTEVVDKAKAADAISPNVVHSLDSAALMLCVLDGADYGIKDFSLIHDSFGTHANDTETLHLAVRQSLINMYQNYCPFEEIRRTTYAAVDAKAKVPEVPTKGTLDLDGILRADYAFA
jgi:DNA-directed RNA polymerase, mitochondrial